MSSLFYQYGKSGKELKASLDRQRKYLDEQIRQSLKNQELVKDFKATQGEIVTPTKYERPLAEQLADRNLQLSKAFNNVNIMIKDADEARKVVDEMDDETIQSFNRYAPLIISEVNRSFGNVTSAFLSDFIDNFIAKQMESRNLINFLSPSDIKNLINDEDNFYRDNLGIGKPVRYKPYEGKISEELFNNLAQQRADLPTTIKDYQKFAVLLDSIRDRLKIDIKKLSQKRGQVNEIKLNENLNWLETIQDMIISVNIELDGLLGNTERFTNTRGVQPEIDEEEEKVEEEDDETFEDALSGEGLKSRRVSNTMSGLGRTRVFLNKKPVYGRGIGLIEPVNRYVPFGKYFINYPSLEDGFIQLRFKSTGTLNDEKLRRKLKISKDLKNLMLDLIEKHKVTKQKYDKLNDEEKELFKYVIEVSKLSKQLGFGVNEEEEIKDEDEKKFKILIGEIRAGNTNKELQRQLLLLISKFILEGRISKNEGDEILKELI